MSSKTHFTAQYVRDRRTFKKLFSNYYSPLCLFADKYLDDIELSKDLVQDVFVKLWERDVKITSKLTMKSFLYVTVRNACLNYMRQNSLNEKRLQDYSELNSESLYEFNVLDEDVNYRLYRAVDRLSPRSREAILLAIQDYSNQEIAEKMEVTINTVKTLKQRAYRRLKQLAIAVLYLIILLY